MGLQRVTVPTHSSPDHLNKDLFFKPATMALGMGNYSDAKELLGLFKDGTDVKDYIAGDKKSPPLQGDRFVEIKENINDLKVEGFSATALCGIIAQTAMIAKAFFSYFEKITHIPGTDYFPFQGAVIPLAQLYLKGATLPELFNKWNNAEDFEVAHQALFKLLGTLGTCMTYMIQLAAYTAFYQVYEGTTLAISSFIFFTSLYDLVVEEHRANQSLEDELHHIPRSLQVK